MDQPFAIVLGTSPTGLYAVRELGRAGINVISAGERRGSAGWSRFTGSRGFVMAQPDATLPAALRRIAQDIGGRGILIPTSDAFIEAIVEAREELSEHYDFQASYCRKTFDRVVDKRHFFEVCCAADIPTPATRLGSHEELLEQSTALKAPFLLKPSLIHEVRSWMAGRKVLLAPDHKALSDALASIPKETTTPWILQEVIPGAESHIRLYGAHASSDGSFHQEFTATKLRQYPAGFGSASLVRSTWDAETAALSRRLLIALGVTGVAGTEFKRDPRDGKLYAIEVNPRPTLWFGATSQAGKRIVLSLHRQLSGQSLPVDTPQDQSVAWRYGLKDMASARQYKRKQGLLPAPDIKEGLKGSRRTNAVFELSDPGPLAGELATYISKGWARLRS